MTNKKIIYSDTVLTTFWMDLMVYIYLFLAIVFEVFATSFLKATQGFTVLGPSLIVGLGYLAAFYFLSLSLQVIPVGIAYAIWAGLGIVLIGLSGFFFLGQRLDWIALAGMGLIILGVLVIKVFSKSLS